MLNFLTKVDNIQFGYDQNIIHRYQFKCKDIIQYTHKYVY